MDLQFISNLKKNFLQRKKTQEVLKCIEDGKRQTKVLRRQYDILKKVGTLVSEPQLKHMLRLIYYIRAHCLG